jgi:hypothetical protein
MSSSSSVLPGLRGVVQENRVKAMRMISPQKAHESSLPTSPPNSRILADPPLVPDDSRTPTGFNWEQNRNGFESQGHFV